MTTLFGVYQPREIREQLNRRNYEKVGTRGHVCSTGCM